MFKVEKKFKKKEEMKEEEVVKEFKPANFNPLEAQAERQRMLLE